jgi:hypothetical protein
MREGQRWQSPRRHRASRRQREAASPPNRHGAYRSWAACTQLSNRALRPTRRQGTSPVNPAPHATHAPGSTPCYYQPARDWSSGQATVRRRPTRALRSLTILSDLERQAPTREAAAPCALPSRERPPLHQYRDPDEPQRRLMPPHHGLMRHPHDPEPQPAHIPVPPTIRRPALRVIPAIDLNDQPQSRHAEVSDVPAQDELTTKPDTQPRAPQGCPKPSLRERERPAEHCSAPRKNDRPMGMTSSRHTTS